MTSLTPRTRTAPSNTRKTSIVLTPHSPCSSDHSGYQSNRNDDEDDVELTLMMLVTMMRMMLKYFSEKTNPTNQIFCV